MLHFISADYIFNGTSFLNNATLVCDQQGVIHDIVYNQFIEHAQHYQGLICPGFINAHCHLELSYLLSAFAPHQGLLHFLKSVNAQRNKYNREEIGDAIDNADFLMWQNGIQAVADICNTDNTLLRKKKSPIKYINFIEVFGIDESKAIINHNYAQELKVKFSEVGKAIITPHAPYSVSKNLFALLNNTDSKQLKSMHNQESQEETDLIGRHHGEFVQFLSNIIGETFIPDFNAPHSLAYVAQQMPLHQQWLWVHNTFTQTKDIDWAIEHIANNYWCLCPAANLFIENALPKHIEHLIKKQQKIVIGTDSLASNNKLCIATELSLLQQNNNKLSSTELLQFATKNGAEMLDLESFGNFNKGSKPGIIQILNFSQKETLPLEPQIHRII
jgi:aminodeoxyfutalosine deaminase